MKRKNRFIIGAVVILAALTYLIYGGMQEALVYFKTPSELFGEQRPAPKQFLRVGGMVVQGSLQKDLATLTYRFRLTDGAHSVAVLFHGVPPDLFAEGKGAVVEGRLGTDGVLLANTIMAKHAEEYSPPKDGQPPHPMSFVPGEKVNNR